MFKTGDKVRVINDHDLWLVNGEPNDTIFEVVEDCDYTLDYINCVDGEYTIETKAVEDWPNDFVKVDEGKGMFELNTANRRNFGSFHLGAIGETPSEFTVQSERFSLDMDEEQKRETADQARKYAMGGLLKPRYPSGAVIESSLVVDGKPSWELSKNNLTIRDSKGTVRMSIDGPSEEELGVFRPNLEDRKVGKVGMHFVDDGFPLALREIAKVMDWAADVKGYKLHDWRNLPNAEIAFPSAGYRHRNDNSVQKAQGLKALDRTDHESNLLHKAHEAFNILAELELILMGKIV